MTTELTNYDFEGHEVRTALVDGEPWFVAKDVAEVLGYADTINAVKQHCRGVVKRHPIVDALGRTQEVRIISEPDVLRLIVSSRLPAAEKFEKWVFEEVLPSIRKTGSYGKPANRIDTIIAGLLAANEVIEEQKAQLEVAHTQLIEQEPKVRFADAVAGTKDSILVRRMAKIITAHGVQTGQNRLFERLRTDGYLCTVGQNRNVPTQRAMDLGLFRLKETAITHSDGHVTTSITQKITGKGQLYFFKKYTGKTGEIVNGEVRDADDVLPPEVGGRLELDIEGHGVAG